MVKNGDKKNPLAISINTHELNAELRKPGFLTRLYDLEIDKEKVRVLPQDISFHPVNDNAEHIDFLRVNEKTKVTIEIPVSFINEEESPGIKRGGILNVTRYNVEVLCPVASIPEKFDFDLTGLEIGDSIHFSDTNVKPTITDRDFTIASIVAPSALTSAESETETEEEDADAETETDETSEDQKEESNEDKKEDSKEEK